MQRWTMFGAAALFGLSTLVVGDDQQRQPGTAGQTGSEKPMYGAGSSTGQFERMHELIGVDVYDSSGKDVGEVTEILLRNGEDRLGYVVCQFDEYDEVDDKYIPLPVNVIHVMPDKEDKDARVVHVVNIDRQKLISAPSLADDKWSNVNEQWARSVDMHFKGLGRSMHGVEGARETEGTRTDTEGTRSDTEGTRSDTEGTRSGTEDPRTSPGTQGGTDREPGTDPTVGEGTRGHTTQPGSTPRVGERARTTERTERRSTAASGRDYAAFLPVSEIVGLDVQNYKDDGLGEIEDLVADMRNGQIIYAILGVGGFLGIGEKMVLVPWPALDLNLDKDIARLNADENLVKEFAFSESDFPNIADRAYAERLYGRFGERPYWEVFGFQKEGRDAFNAWKQDSQYLKQFKKENVKDYEGTVLSVGSFRLEAGAAPGLRLRVKANDGQMLTVHAGPRAHALRQDLRFSNGDKVKIKGCEATIDNQKVIIASEIQRDGKTLRLLQDGSPAWNADELMQQSGMGEGQQGQQGWQGQQHQQGQQGTGQSGTQPRGGQSGTGTGQTGSGAQQGAR